MVYEYFFMPNKRQLFLQHVAQTSPDPMCIEIERGKGCQLFSPDGKRYLDLNAGISVSALGHSHPKVVAAVQNQAAKYMHTMVYGEHLQSPQVELATLLTSQLPEKLNQVYFTMSGAEAVEGAMKLAKKYTGRYEIVTCRAAYHGSTHGPDSLRSDHYGKSGYWPFVPGIRHITFNNCDDLDQITNKTAAVVTEIIQAEKGINLPTLDWLLALRDKCDQTGTLLIFDEIQTGYGRTGILFAFQKYGIVPDILLTAKAMGGGMPLGAFISDQKILNCFTNNPVLGHITTFGGHPVSCAAGLAALKVLLQENHIADVPQKEMLFHHLLQHPEIKEIRSAGLMMAIELSSTELLMRIVKYCWDNGVLLDWFLFDTKSLRISPPLIISEAEIREGCGVILEGFRKN